MSATGRGDRGQATVELALVLPLVALLVLLVLQVGLVVRDHILVTHAAREAARAAAVADGDRAAAAHRGAERSADLDSGRLHVTTTLTGGGERVRVHVAYDSVTDVPLVGMFVPDVGLSGDATMRVEQRTTGTAGSVSPGRPG